MAQRICLVSEVEGRLTGFLVARVDTVTCELENIVVADEWRRRGTGSRLLQKLISTVREDRLQRVQLEVRESNSVARSLYRNLGFVESGRRKKYYPNPTEDAVLYTLILKAAD